MNIEEIELTWRHFYQHSTISKELLANANLRAILPATTDHMVLQITAMIAGERVKEIRYPISWWQSCRERFLPAWWLKMYPVRYHTWKVDFLYPEIDRRKVMSPRIAIYSSRSTVASDGYPHFEDTHYVPCNKRVWVPMWLWAMLSTYDDD